MPPKKKATNGYKLPDPLPKDEILEDRSKKKWRLGTSIGKGGFGEIYCAQPADVTGTKYQNVIKIEPHANGPLFVEMHFYMRNGKSEDINKFKTEHKLSTFGMPAFLGSGSHEYKGEKYRFLVIERFGTDIWKLYKENKNKFPEATVFQIGLQILDVLEYMHERNYVHMDIKGANILMGITKETKDKQVYLVDFGLATKYSTEKEFKPNPKKAHDGTIEYLSRDAHKGVPTRRGDLEILIYNLIHWLGCPLPWEKNISDPKVVEKSKEENMETVAKMTKACFGTKKPPAAITDYLTYLKTLKFDSEPDYDKLRKILTKGVKDAGGKVGSVLKFSVKRKSDAVSTPQKKKQKKIGDETPKKGKNGNNDELETQSKTPTRRSLRTPQKQVNSHKGNETEDSDDEQGSEDEESSPINRKATGTQKKLNGVTKPKSNDSDDEESLPMKRKGRIPQKKINKPIESDDEDLVIDESSDEKPSRIKRKAPGAQKKNKKLKTSEDEDESKPLPIKRKAKGPQKKVNEPKTASDDTGVIYTDAMKEILLKKQEKTKKPVKPRRATVDVPPSSDEYKGYTESMRELAMKRNAKKTATENAK